MLSSSIYCTQTLIKKPSLAIFTQLQTAKYYLKFRPLSLNAERLFFCRENSRLYFIFEYVRADLLGLMREKPNENFPEFWIRTVVQQVLQVSKKIRLGLHANSKQKNS